MKPVLSLVFIFMAAATLQAQAYPLHGPDRELKFNAGLFLATGAVEGAFEYFFGPDLSVSGSLYWDNDPYDYNGNFGIGPSLRAYFGYQPRSGFFAEAFGLYFKGKDQNNSITAGYIQPYDSFALGLGAGNKWTTRSQRFSLELFGGIGRNLDPEAFQDPFVYRAGLNIGIRF